MPPSVLPPLSAAAGWPEGLPGVACGWAAEVGLGLVLMLVGLVGRVGLALDDAAAAADAPVGPLSLCSAVAALP